MLRIPQNYETPYYETNKDWYYFDFRSMRNKLTDKVNDRALDSYLDYLIDLRPRLTVEHAKELIKKDLEDYTKNKNKYVFDIGDDGVKILTSIDGKKLDITSVMFSEE